MSTNPTAAADGVPEGAERFVVAEGTKPIRTSAHRLAELGDDVLEEYDIELPPEPDDHITAWSVELDPGDEIPPEVARSMLPGFADMIAIYAPDGERLDDNAGADRQQALHTGPEFPPDAVRFEMLRGDHRVSAGKVRELGEETLEEYGIEVDARGRAVIEEGEPLPPDLVATVYASFHDKIAAYDAEGNRVA